MSDSQPSQSILARIGAPEVQLKKGVDDPDAPRSTGRLLP